MTVGKGNGTTARAFTPQWHREMADSLDQLAAQFNGRGWYERLSRKGLLWWSNFHRERADVR